jgi:hypothetical protein
VSDVKNAERMLKALKNDYENNRLALSEYLRLSNSYEEALRQAREREAGQ